MDKTPIEPMRLEGGKRFVAALNHLGLNSPLALWVRLQNEPTFVLMIVTDFLDLKGPLELTRYMFAAYNADALPHEIDPFNVQFCSPASLLGRRLIDVASVKITAHDTENGIHDIRGELTFDNYATWYDWFIVNEFAPQTVYERDINRAVRKPDQTRLRRQWHHFVSNIDKLAA